MEKQVMFGFVVKMATMKEVDVIGRDLLEGPPIAFQGLLATALEPEFEKSFSLKGIQ